MLPLVLKMAGEEGMEHTDGVGDEEFSSCGVDGSFGVTTGWCSIPLIDFLRACFAFCKGFPGEVKRLASEATFPNLFFLLLGQSSSSRDREWGLTLSSWSFLRFLC